MTDTDTDLGFSLTRRMRYINIVTAISSGVMRDVACKEFGASVRTFQRMQVDYAEEANSLLATQASLLTNKIGEITQARLNAADALIDALDNNSGDDTLTPNQVIAIDNKLAKMTREIAEFAVAFNENVVPPSGPAPKEEGPEEGGDETPLGGIVLKRKTTTVVEETETVDGEVVEDQ